MTVFTNRDVRLHRWFDTANMTDLWGVQVRHNGAWKHIVSKGAVFLVHSKEAAQAERRSLIGKSCGAA